MLPAPVRAVAPRLQLVLERAMGKQPEDRFDTGYEMAEALRQVIGGGRGDEQQSTRVSPMPVAGIAPRAERRPNARPGTEPRLDADTLQALEHKLIGLCRPDRPHPGAHDVAAAAGPSPTFVRQLCPCRSPTAPSASSSVVRWTS